MTRRDIILKWIAYGVALIAVAVFNFDVLGCIPISLPLLLPMAAIAAGILEGPKFGAAYGMVAGMLLSAAGHRSLLCIPLLALLGWVCGLLAVHILRRDLVGYLICAALAMLLWELVQVALRLAAGTAAPALLIKTALGEYVWTVLFSLPVYWACRFCCRHYGRIYHE